jgi:toxoflavin synthase
MSNSTHEQEFKGEDSYQNIEEDYGKSKMLPARRYFEIPSFLRELGQLENEDVLDLACGEGFYTRMVRSRTKGEVYGADISPGMIELAEKQLESTGDDIQYIVADCSAPLELNQKFDVVLAAFLLVYAQNEKMLYKFVKNAYASLKPGGRFIGIDRNHARNAEHIPTLRKYGYNVVYDKDKFEEGDIIKILIRNDELGIDFEIHNYYHSKETYQRAFKRAGFTDLKWTPLQISEEVTDKGFW